MTRKEFIKICGILGIGIPFQIPLKTLAMESVKQTQEDIIIIGAGAAGLTAAYHLKQKGIIAPILEASSVYGGRFRHTTDFVDFPLPLGAEWLHVERDIFADIINDPTVKFEVETVPYDEEKDWGWYKGQKLSPKEAGFGIDQKFVNTGWFDFYDRYILPSIKEQISFHQVVHAIDYTGEKIRIHTTRDTFVADKVIITIPIKMLQSGAIKFKPELPEKKAKAIRKVKVWDGFKAFIEFSEKFYPNFVGFEVIPESDGEKAYYDAAFGQKSSRHILGLFTVGTGTMPYRQLSDDELISFMLKELDELFDGQASQHYIKHFSHNWNTEPFANGAYLQDDQKWKRVRELGKSVANKLYFAGDAYTDGEEWSSVDQAARSAIRAVNEIVG